MRRYLLRRIWQNIITLFLFLTLVYVLLDLQPGDFGDLYLSDPRLTPSQRQILRANLGLDRPVLVRYGLWLRDLFRDWDDRSLRRWQRAQRRSRCFSGFI